MGISQVVWNQAEDFNPQPSQPEQSVPESTGRSSLASWAQPALWASPEPVTEVVTLPPARSPSQRLHQTTPKVIDRGSLARTLQTELKRVGCYDGHIDGDWTLSTRNAMKDFTEYVNAKLPVGKPDGVLLSLLQGHEGKTCRGSCPPGQGLRDGHCIPDALIALARKPEKAAPLIAQSTSHPNQEKVGERKIGRASCRERV